SAPSSARCESLAPALGHLALPRAGGSLDTHGSLRKTRSPQVRVIAGTFRGRGLVAPRGLSTRPTSDRVREALFMSLEPLTGTRVAALFAGSVALGIEALSLGASRVACGEASPL